MAKQTKRSAGALAFDAAIGANYDKYLTIARKMCNGEDDPRDVCNEIMAEMLSMPDEKKEKIEPYAEYYVIQAMKYSFRSDTSRYRRKYCMVKTVQSDFRSLTDSIENPSVERDGPKQEVTLQFAENTLNELGVPYFDKTCFMEYVSGKHKSWRAYAAATGISDSSLFAAYARAREALRAEMTRRARLGTDYIIH